MFDFIGECLERITRFFAEAIAILIIVLGVLLLLLAANRHNNNPYADHTKERIERQIEDEKEAKYNETLELLYKENSAQ